MCFQAYPARSSVKAGQCGPVLRTHGWSQVFRNDSGTQIHGFLEGLWPFNSLAFLLCSSLFCYLWAVYIGPLQSHGGRVEPRFSQGPLLTQSWSDSTREPEQVPQRMCIPCRLCTPRDTCGFLTWLQHKAWHLGDLQSSHFPGNNSSAVLKLWDVLFLGDPQFDHVSVKTLRTDPCLSQTSI